MNIPPCPDWCTRHLVEEDERGGAVDVHRGSVTFGGLTVNVETSPDWPAPAHPIVPPDLTELTAREARDLATALLEAARLIDGCWP